MSTPAEKRLAEIDDVLAIVTHQLHVIELEVKPVMPLASARLRASRALIRGARDELRMHLYGKKPTKLSG